MEINHYDFQRHFPSILKAILLSRFVSIDLELSGIPSRQAIHSKYISGAYGKKTLQQHYAEIKSAAEKYQVLQLGLTCIEEDLERGCYVLQTYNFNLQPVPDATLHIERDIIIQSSALDFLRLQGYRLEDAVYAGIPYLSREDEIKSKSTEVAIRDSHSLITISLHPGDLESQKFVNSVRQHVTDYFYTNRNNDEAKILDVPPAGFDDPGYNGRELNKFQKKLVHQLIRDEFPELRSISRTSFIQIIPLDEERERRHQQKRILQFEERLRDQIGLRFLAEALCPNIDSCLEQELSGLKVHNLHCCKDWAVPPGMLGADQKEAIINDYTSCVDALQDKKTVLIGHNLFLDLVYFFKCFFGNLPDNVEDFIPIMQAMFPVIFDTKFLADHLKKKFSSSNSSLKVIVEELGAPDRSTPVIEVPPNFNKYFNDQPTHEAGYDSYLTAVAFIRISTQADGSNKVVVSSTANENEDVGSIRSKLSNTSLSVSSSSEEGGISLDRSSQSIPPSARNVLEALASTNLDGVPENSTPEPQEVVRTLVPCPSSPFWTKYSNILRVNGTQEGVFNITKAGVTPDIERDVVREVCRR